jgi:hypothetical protein
MPYISGSVTISNTVTTEIRGTVKNELVGTNTRLEAIENELGRITSHLATIAKSLQNVSKKNGTKPHRHIESVAPPIAVQEELEQPKKKSTTRSTARSSRIKTTGTVSSYKSTMDSLRANLLKKYSSYSDEETVQPPIDW